MSDKNNKTHFFRNVLTLSTGALLAQIIAFLGAPILTRLYTPEEFGVLAVFFMFGNVCVTIASGRYELGVVLPKEDSVARKLVKTAVTLTIYISLIGLFFFTFCYPLLGEIFNLEEYDWVLLLIPFFILATAVFDSLRCYAIRNKLFKDIAISTFSKALTLFFLQVVFGVLGGGAGGLILGVIISLFVGNRQLLKIFVKDKQKNECLNLDFSFREYKNEMKTYIDFPKYSTFSALLNTISLQLPILFFSMFFSTTITGFFSLTYRVINLPMTLLGNAIGDVYIQKASEVKNDQKKLSELTWTLYKTLLMLGVIPAFTLWYFGEELFVIVFGEEWRMSGGFASVLSFWILGVFICSPISKVLIINEQQRKSVFFQIVVFISRFLLFAVALMLHFTPMQTMVYFGIIGALLFFCLIVYILMKMDIPFYKIMLYTVMILIIGQGSIYLISLYI